MPISVTGWRWVRCSVRIGRSKRSQDAKKHAPGQKVHGDRNGKEFDSKAKTTPCPGCAKCEVNGGYRLRKGKWRPTTSHEVVFLFSKNADYYADGDAVQEKATGRGPGNKSHKGEQAYRDGDETMRTKAGLAHTGARKTRNPRDVWVIASENYSGKHFAAYPTALVKRCMEAATPVVGCCPHCRMPWSPVVETKRVPTRPGTNSKVDAMILDPDSPYWDHSGTIAGNRDPKRHSTVSEVLGYRQSCRCEASEPRPCLILDPFAGSGTTLQTAIWYGRDSVGIELNEEYLPLIEARVQQPPRCLIREQNSCRVSRKQLPDLAADDGLFAGVEE